MHERVLHADESLIVALKPAGLLAVPGRGADKADCLAVRLQQRYADALVVHRLDMSTSGLMLMARGAAAQRALGRAFEARQIAKHYTAVVAGLVDADEGAIDLPLAADWPRRPLQKVDAAGKAASTRWRVIGRDAAAGTTRLALQPLTGRSHQLRVHLAAIGHPIVGDALYAPATTSHDLRLLLHACRLELAHPAHGAALCFVNEAPF